MSDKDVLTKCAWCDEYYQLLLLCWVNGLRLWLCGECTARFTAHYILKENAERNEYKTLDRVE